MATDRKNPHKFLDGNPSALMVHSGHKLQSRRDFLSAGLIRFSAVMTAPTLYSLVKSEMARAACGADAAGNNFKLPVVIEIAMAGGPALFHFTAKSENYESLPNYTLFAMGTNTDAEANSIDLFGAPKMLFDRSRTGLVGNGFAPGYRRDEVADATARAAVTSYLDSTTAVVIRCATGDDSANNPLSGLALMQRLGGAKGSNIPNATEGGSFRHLVVGNAIGFEEPASLGVGSLADFNRAMIPDGVFGSQLSASERGFVFDQLKKLNEAHAAKAVARNLASAPKLLDQLSCTGEVNGAGALAPVPVVDPFSGPHSARMVQIWGNANQRTGQDNVAAVGVYAAMLGISGPVFRLNIGGCDYHNGTQISGNAKDREASTLIAKISETIKHLSEQPGAPITKGAVYLSSDGSVQCSPTLDLSGVWANDRGSSGTQVVHLVGVGNSRPSLSQKNGTPDYQVGSMNTGQGSVGPSGVMAWNPTFAGLAAYSNIMKFAGPECFAAFRDSIRVFFSEGGAAGAAAPLTDAFLARTVRVA